MLSFYCVIELFFVLFWFLFGCFGLLEGLFVFLDVFLHCDFGAELGDEVVGDGFGVFEADAAFSDVGFGVGLVGVFLFEPVEELGVEVEGHVVEGGVVFLGGDGHEGEGFFGVGVVAFGVGAVGDDVGDHSVLDGFLKAWGEVGEDGLSEFLDGLFFVWW